MLDYLRRRRNRLISDGQQAAAETKIFLRRAENLLIGGGILAVAAGILMLVQGFRQMPVAVVIVLGIGLVAGTISRRAGWLLTTVALILLVVAALI